MAYLTLRINGEVWATYPLGLCFPPAFRYCYPMRGRGHVSRILYLANKLCLDRFLLARSECPIAQFDGIPEKEEIACFWPAPSRSLGRFYGYRVRAGHVISYLKFGMTDEESARLRREADNMEHAIAIPHREFKIPLCKKIVDSNARVVLEFEALPSDAREVPSTEKWLSRVLSAGRQIRSAGYQHGDFAWQNFKVSGNDLWIIDWEEMSADLPDIVDEITCKMVFAHYNKRLGVRETWEQFKKEYLNGDFEWKAIRMAVESMAERKIAMGEILLACWDSELMKLG